MNAKQINRAQKNTRGYVVADILYPAGHFATINMVGRHISHRRIKAAMQAAKREWPHADVFLRYEGTMITPEIAAEWQNLTAANGYWWPKLAKWAKKAAKTANKINMEE